MKDKKAENAKVLDMRSTSPIADYMLVCSGRSDRQVKSIAESVRSGLKKRGCYDIGTEGYSEGQWILVDYGDVIVHIFNDEMRKFYDIESLWPNAIEVRESK